MLPYQPNSESCLIGCYDTEEVAAKTFHRPVSDSWYLHLQHFTPKQRLTSFVFSHPAILMFRGILCTRLKMSLSLLHSLIIVLHGGMIIPLATFPSVNLTAAWGVVLTAHTTEWHSPRLRPTPCRRYQATHPPRRDRPPPRSPSSPLNPATQASTASAPESTDAYIRSTAATPTDKHTTSAQATPLESREDVGI